MGKSVFLPFVIIKLVFIYTEMTHDETLNFSFIPFL